MLEMEISMFDGVDVPTGGYFAPINILLQTVHRREKSRLRVDVLIIGGTTVTTCKMGIIRHCLSVAF
jgi:hypothetical protein